MATTIKLKNGTGAPSAGALVVAEPALDLTNKRLYTEDSGGTVIEVGTNPTSVTTGDITATGTATFAGLTTTADVLFGDNDKAIFGAGSDLQIYHDGSNSLIADAGAGLLRIQSNGTSVNIYDSANSQNMAAFNTGADARLFHNGSLKLATTSTGIDVTGTVTADDSITLAATPTSLDENRLIFNETPAAGSLGSRILWRNPSTGYDYASVGFTNEAGSSGGLRFKTASSVFSDSDALRMKIADNGDISFYEDTGTTAKFFWDASAESLGIGTSSPAYKLDIYGSSTTNIDLLHLLNSNNTLGCSSGIMFENYSGGGLNQGRIKYLNAGSNNSNSFVFEQEINAANGLVETMRIDSSGNVGIGTSSPAKTLDVRTSNGSDSVIRVGSSNSIGINVNVGTIEFYSADPDDAGVKASIANYVTGNQGPGGSVDGNLIFSTTDSDGGGNDSPTERMRIDSSGNVGIGTDSPDDYSFNTGSILAVGTGANDTISVVSGTTGSGHLAFADGTSGTARYRGLVQYSHSTDSMRLFTSGTEAMRIDSSGNLLVGTTDTAPGVADTNVGVALNSGRVFASAEADYALNLNRNTSDGDIVRFRKDGSTVGSIATWDSDFAIGQVNVAFKFDDGGNQILPWSVNTNLNRDNAIDLGDSTSRWKDLYLSGGLRGDTTFKNNAGTTEYARFDSSGNLLVGKTNTTLATAGAEIRSDGFIRATVSDATCIQVNRTTGTGTAIDLRYAGTSVGSIVVGASSTTYNTSSDQRLKENIVDAPSASDDINAIQVRSFDWKADGSHQKYGMVAQELQSVAPEAVTGDADSDEMMGVDYSKLVPMLVKEIQSLRARVAQLEGAN